MQPGELDFELWLTEIVKWKKKKKKKKHGLKRRSSLGDVLKSRSLYFDIAIYIGNWMLRLLGVCSLVGLVRDGVAHSQGGKVFTALPILLWDWNGAHGQKLLWFLDRWILVLIARKKSPRLASQNGVSQLCVWPVTFLFFFFFFL